MITTSRSGKSPVKWIIGIAVLAVLALVVIVMSRSMTGGNYESVPVDQFAANPRAFAGNTYELEGRIETQLGYDERSGRILLTRDLATEFPVPILVPASIAEFSPNPGQIYRFELGVDRNGVLTVKTFKKL